MFNCSFVCFTRRRCPSVLACLFVGLVVLAAAISAAVVVCVNVAETLTLVHFFPKTLLPTLMNFHFFGVYQRFNISNKWTKIIIVSLKKGKA